MVDITDTLTLVIGFSSLGILAIGSVATFYIGYGELKNQSKITQKYLELVEKNNSASHDKMFERQNKLSKEVALIEQHTGSINGSITKNSEAIQANTEMIQDNMKAIAAGKQD